MINLDSVLKTKDITLLTKVLIHKAIVFPLDIHEYKSRTIKKDSLVAKLCPIFATPWTVACQAPLSMRFSRQEYWSGLPFLSPWDFLTQESNLGLLHCRQILYQLSYEGTSNKNDHWSTDAFGLSCCRRLESLLDCKEIKPVNPKGNQSWKFIGRSDGEAKAPIHWPPDGKSWFIGKEPDAWKGWRSRGSKRMSW